MWCGANVAESVGDAGRRYGYVSRRRSNNEGVRRVPLIATLAFLLTCAAVGSAAARAQKSHPFRCAYVHHIGDATRVYFTMSVSPRRLGYAWCVEFQHHFHPALSSHGAGTGKLGTGHRFCVLVRRTPAAHAVLRVYANRSFAGIVTCKAFRTFPPPGFRRVK
jgi:hypothetical protein